MHAVNYLGTQLWLNRRENRRQFSYKADKKKPPNILNMCFGVFFRDSPTWSPREGEGHTHTHTRR